MKFDDWDLTDREKFPQLETRNLMKQNIEGVVTTLEPQKWLRKVEDAGILNLLWVPHFHCAPIAIFVIKQPLYLVHDGYLWLEESIPITANLIHQISQLPIKGNDPTAIAGKSSDLALVEAMKAKSKLEKRKWWYAIACIKDQGVCVAT